MKWQIIPSTTEGAIHAGRLFGFDKVNAGDWLSPVYVIGITDEEAEVASSLLEEVGFTIKKVGS